jgi:predicted nucleic acid-binding protein
MAQATPQVVVVDTSLAVKWVLQEQDTPAARGLLISWAANGIQPIAPSWFSCEAANVLFQRLRADSISLGDAQSALATLVQHVEIRDYDPAVSLRAIEIASQIGQRQSHDSHYVALAEHEGCELWTADQRFWSIASPRFPRVNWVGNVRI